MSAVLTEPLYHVELIDGREVPKPLPKKLHVLIERYLIVELSLKLPANYLALPELNLLTGGKTVDGRREYVVPDVVVVGRSARYEEGDLAEPPLWAVEILSPGQTIGDLFIRAERLLKLGCPMVWVIWPEKRKAWEYTQANLEELGGKLTGQLPNGTDPAYVNVHLTEMWAALE